jgi:hypothetical protein
MLKEFSTRVFIDIGPLGFRIRYDPLFPVVLSLQRGGPLLIGPRSAW